MSDYIKQLEEQNENLKQLLAASEQKLQKYLPKRQKRLYNNVINDVCDRLVNKIQSLPGIEIRSCTTLTYPISIIFYVIPSQDNVGLFILTRSIDPRYWKYGRYWSLTVDVSDIYDYDNVLPIAYRLFYNQHDTETEAAFTQAEYLIKNIDAHLNHENFLKGYEITQERLKESI